MGGALALQYLGVAAAVVASAAYVVVTRFPSTVRRVRGWVAIRMVDSGSPTLARFGRRIAPRPPVQDGCGACGGCDPG